jgi:predicted nuclease of predicted toxin-antitoxin system
VRFLLDHDVYAVTCRFLSDLGHDVVRASDIGLAQATDNTLLQSAIQNLRILVTRDRDFGNLVFVQRIAAGVIYLRIQPLTLDAVHRELDRALSLYNETELLSAFVVVEPSRHRFRRVTP